MNRKGRKDGKEIESQSPQRLQSLSVEWMCRVIPLHKSDIDPNSVIPDAIKSLLSLRTLRFNLFAAFADFAIHFLHRLRGSCDSILLRFIFFFVAFALPAIQISAQTLPEPPPILMGNFGPEVREQLQKVEAEFKSRPRDAETNGRMGMTLQTYEEHRIAAVYYQRALMLQPDDFRWVYYLALVRAALGEHDQASKGFMDALRMRPDYLPAQLRLADSLFAAGRIDESRRIYESLIEKKAGFPQASYGLGRILAARRDPAAAVEQYRRAIDLYPAYGAAYYALGMALRDLGETEKARENLELYRQYRLARPPLEDPLSNQVAQLNTAGSEILKRGAILEAAGQIEQSIAEHERALTVNPQLTQAHINLISLYARTGAFDKAQQHYRDVVAINPNLDDSHYNYGVMLVQQGRTPEAAAAFLRSLQANPLNAEAHHNYAVMIEGEGRLDEAAEHYRRAIENKPAHRSARFHLGRILVNQGKPNEAIEQFLQTLTPEDEETPRYLYALGATYIRAGEREKGVIQLREALKLALKFGQSQLAASLERDLKTLNQNP